MTAEPGPPRPALALPGSPHGRGLAEAGGAVQWGGGLQRHGGRRRRGAYVAGGRGGGGQRRAGRAGRRGVGAGRRALHVVQSVAEVSHQLGSQPHVHSGDRCQAAGHFVGGVGESSSEAVGVHCGVQ